MGQEQKNESWLSQLSGPVVLGLIAVFLSFGGPDRQVYLLVGVLLIVGGLIVNAIKSRP